MCGAPIAAEGDSCSACGGDLGEAVRRHAEDIEQAVRADSTRIAREVGLTGSATDAASPGDRRRRSAVWSRLRPDPLQQLEHATDAFRELFEVDRWLPSRVGRLGHEPRYCETLAEFLEPFVAASEGDGGRRERYRQRLQQEAHSKLPGGIEGAYFPGRGCFLNGWLFGRRAAARSARLALGDPEVAPAIFRTAIHEQLGHGFLTELTAAGAEKKSLHLLRAELASGYALARPPAAASQALADKWDILFRSSLFLEEGFATWIERYMLETLRETTAGESDYTSGLADYGVAAVRTKLVAITRGRDRTAARAAAVVAAALERVAAGRAEPHELHRAVVDLQHREEELSAALVGPLRRELRYVVGTALLSLIEVRCGAACVPYAAAIAAHRTFLDGEHGVGPETLARYVDERPEMNLDSRLARLCRIELRRKGDVAEMARLARDELGLTPPPSLLDG